MASIDSVTLSSAGTSGSATGNQDGIITTSYKAQYRVKTTDVLSASYILGHFQQNADLPWPGRWWNVAGGFDPTSICNRVDAKWTEMSGGQFIVDVSYEPSQFSGQPEEKQTENGNNTTNPLLWADEIDISYYPISIPVEGGQFVGFDPGNISNPFIAPGNILPICNSALTPFDPTLEDEAEIKVLRIGKYSQFAQAAAFNDYIGAINGDDVVIDKPRYGYSDRIGKFRGRIKGLNATFAITNGIPHFKQTLEVHISPLLYGWFRPVIDRGVLPRRALGDPNGKGGRIVEADLADEGVPTNGIIQDTNGAPLSEPALFDGNGQPLKTAAGARPVVMVWNLRKIRPFSVIRW